MQIPLVIGRNSSGLSYSIDLSSLPHLFISYNEEDQLIKIFKELIQDIISVDNPTKMAISVSQRISAKLFPLVSAPFQIEFTHSDPPGNAITSIDYFIGAVLVELKTRKRRMGSLKKAKLLAPALIVFMDDIFEVVMAKRKTALSFIELLVNGPDNSIHFITGSSGMYKNLLDQLITMSPAVKKKMGDSKQRGNINEPLAAQLIINPDGLVFFKGKCEKEFVKLYAI